MTSRRILFSILIFVSCAGFGKGPSHESKKASAPFLKEMPQIEFYDVGILIDFETELNKRVSAPSKNENPATGFQIHNAPSVGFWWKDPAGPAQVQALADSSPPPRDCKNAYFFIRSNLKEVALPAKAVSELKKWSEVYFLCTSKALLWNNKKELWEVATQMDGKDHAWADVVNEADKQSLRNLKKLSQNWNPPAQKAFDSLMKAAEAFQKQETTYYDIALSKDLFESFRFQQHVFKVEHDGPPTYSEADLKTADQELNRFFGVMVKSMQESTKSADGALHLRETEKAWDQYRDAWVAFGLARFPDSKADAWKAWLTKERIEQLKLDPF